MADEAPKPPPTRDWREFGLVVDASAGIELGPLLDVANKARKRFTVISRKDVIAASPDIDGNPTAVAQSFRELLDRERDKKLAPPEEDSAAAGKGGKPVAKPAAAKAPVKKPEAVAAPPPTGIDDAPADSPDMFYIFDGFPRTLAEMQAAHTARVPVNAAIFVVPKPPPVVSDDEEEEALPPPIQFSAFFQQLQSARLETFMSETVLDTVYTADAPALFDSIAALCYRVVYEQQVHKTWLSKVQLIDIPDPLPIDTKLYKKLADSVPSDTASVPFLLDCMFQQVVRALQPVENVVSLEVDEDEAAIAALLDNALGRLSAPAVRTAPPVEAEKPLLIRYSDQAERRNIVAGDVKPSVPHAQPPLEVEKKLWSTVPVPARNRRGLPAEPVKPDDVRGMEQTELATFTRLPAAIVERARLLKHVQEVYKQIDPARPLSTDDLVYSEMFSPLEFAQVYSNAIIQSSAITTRYNEDDDSLVVALNTAVPARRREEKHYRPSMPVDRGFGPWRTHYAEALTSIIVPPVDEAALAAEEAAKAEAAAIEAAKAEEAAKAAEAAAAKAAAEAAAKAPAKGAAKPASVSKPAAATPAAPEAVKDEAPLAQAVKPIAVPVSECAKLLPNRPSYLYRLKHSYPVQVSQVAYPFDGGVMTATATSDEIRTTVRCGSHLIGVRNMTATALARAKENLEREQQAHEAAKAAVVIPVAEAVPAATTVPAATPAPATAAATPTTPSADKAQARPPTSQSQVKPGAKGAKAAAPPPEPVAPPPVVEPPPPAVEPTPQREITPLPTVAVGLPHEHTFFASLNDLLVDAWTSSDSTTLGVVTVDGLVVQQAISGTIQQSYATDELRKAVAGPAQNEASRTIIGKGTVIRHLLNGTIQILLSTGDTAEYKDESWIVTNMRGIRYGTRADGTEYYVPDISASNRTDPETGEVVLTRQDMTMVIRAPDGTYQVHHADGTHIAVSGDTVQVHAPGFVTVELNPIVNSSRVELPNAYIDRLRENVVLQIADGSAVRVTDGQATFEPAKLHPLGADPSQLIAHNVFVTDLRTGQIQEVDAEGNSFVVSPEGALKVSLIHEPEDQLVKLGEIDEQDADGTEAPTQKPAEPVKASMATETALAGFAARDLSNEPVSHPPRVFVVSNDGSAMELLRASDIAPFAARMESDPGTQILEEAIGGDDGARQVTYLTRLAVKHRSHGDHNIKLPGVAAVDRGYQAATEARNVLLFRQLVYAPPLSNADADQLHSDLMSFEAWRQRRDNYAASMMEISDPRSAADLKVEAELQERFLKERSLRSNRASQQESAAAEKLSQMERSQRLDGRPHTAASSRPGTAFSKKLESEDLHPPPSRQIGQPHAPSTPYNPRSPAGGRLAYFNSEPGTAFLREARRTEVVTAATIRKAEFPPKSDRQPRGTTQQVLPPVKAVPRPTAALPAAQTIDADLAQDLQDALDMGDDDFEQEQPEMVLPPPQLPTTVDLRNPQRLSGSGKLSGSKASGSLGLSKSSAAVPPRQTPSPLEVTLTGKPRDKIIAVRKPAPGVPNERHLAVEGTVTRQVKTVSAMQTSAKQSNYVKGCEVYPSEVNFGPVALGSTFRMPFTARNISHDVLRFRIKQADNLDVRVVFQPRQIAPGMSMSFEVELHASALGPIATVVEVLTAKDVVPLSVLASVVSVEEYTELKSSKRLTSKAKQLDERPADTTGRPGAFKKPTALPQRDGQQDSTGSIRQQLAKSNYSQLGDDMDAGDRETEARLLAEMRRQ
eukprot:TRINITY_DN6249_c0_g1_i1.p1 TRINITY_DN6249_c0_g1~~TRINITY_DN6249_c0_g1_i1.p1  ORF type:complete len:1750 (+),score=491.00 TRINITY_DN6249_c0_g1_i1:80-5329(+)